MVMKVIVPLARTGVNSGSTGHHACVGEIEAKPTGSNGVGAPSPPPDAPADRSPIAEEGWFQVGQGEASVRSITVFPVKAPSRSRRPRSTPRRLPSRLAIVTMVDRSLQDEHPHACALVAVAPRV
jgi:hypothetical protein